jgi:hypothetical protein
VLLLVCSDVKDPFYLVEAFERWRREARNDVHLIIVGSLVDEAYQSLAERYAVPHQRVTPLSTSDSASAAFLATVAARTEYTVGRVV